MDDVKELTAYVNDQKLDTPILLDAKRLVGPKIYGVTGYPTTIFVDKLGIVRRVSVGWGPTALDKFNNLVTELTITK